MADLMVLIELTILDWLYNLEYNQKPKNSLDELLKQAVKMSEDDKI